MQTSVVNTDMWTRSWMAWELGPTGEKEGSDCPVIERHDASLTQRDIAGCFLRQKKPQALHVFSFVACTSILISCTSADHAFVPYYDTQRSANMKMMNHLIITQPAPPLAPCNSWVKRAQVQNVL